LINSDIKIKTIKEVCNILYIIGDKGKTIILF